MSRQSRPLGELCVNMRDFIISDVACKLTEVCEYVCLDAVFSGQRASEEEGMSCKDQECLWNLTSWRLLLAEPLNGQATPPPIRKGYAGACRIFQARHVGLN